MEPETYKEIMITETKTPDLTELYPGYFSCMEEETGRKREEFLSPFFEKIVKEFKKALNLEP